MDRLTALLRYTLYEPSGFVSLEKEWKFIEDFIALEQMRYPQPLSIVIQKEEFGANIPPFSLIPLIENAFKHGDLSSVEKPMRIRLSQKDNLLYFYVENAIGKQQKDKTGGIGLDNLNKRLSLIYPEQFYCKADASEDMYRIQLCFPLNPPSNAEMPNH